ncbi:hypothetical protein GV794_13055 [Nocardia cyriacigeorgica]|uniref:Lipoprotein n=1 Tax=Nocardia cyriacigeorgica TaxID=135487 RepID=A0A6P1CZ44_9NOCA|nr:hypothetical protein [Nocardia cyriacigeorgica]NEW43405.1 hypothetical protein [Nocardia cyriacigeorgica]NEW51528.1 hypothetical protein [Nocardia cyriacigeorgica]NEW56575.1 hypothetical protein [Nocardia cyriacigeorgica]
MIRTSAAIAASACALALFVAGCEDETTSSVSQTTAATSASATATASGSETSDAAAPSTDDKGEMSLDSVKVSSFVIGYKQAFPSLAEGRSDEEIGEIFTETCEDIHEGKAEDEILTEVSNRTKNGRGSASPEESKAIYEMIKVLC